MTTTEQLYTAFLKCSGISIDSRTVEPGNLFFALKGGNTDGNAFADNALQSGARYVVIDRPEFDKQNGQYLLVPDALTALQDLALHHRKQLRIPVIAITGSNGKTTTKELVSAVLSTAYRTLATKGNLNNHIGVPLTLLSITPQTQIAVIEMGANRQGDINQLCSFALPNFGLITNIGKAHLEGFGGVEGVIKGKGELFEYLEGAEGRAFVNLNDSNVADLAYYLQKVTTYGSAKRAKVYAESLGCRPFLQIRWHLPKSLSQEMDTPYLDINTHLTGTYNTDNVLAAIAVGLHFKVEPLDIVNAIASYIPQNNRSQIMQKGSNTLILDAYNANPTSMTHALMNFEDMPAQHKVAIVGDMLEMGEFSEAEHLRMVNLLQTLSFKQVVLIGPQFGKVIGKSNFLHFNTAQEAKEWFQTQHFEQTHILLKGSRGMALEKILE
ncbi:MAG: UDP-N-acetylmuramoyl-tripeptide--D-alanyl-D-alanine ligase [Sphingobacteriales bacterium]|nr:MAG: UDP-N-acetylmuramoyl-tripeptide--D-alanyl-D-alanine ligase [Sphingobacteriales bacterium]